MAGVQKAGKDPITWSFVKLFGRHLACDLQPFEGLPASHAWRWQAGGLWRARLLTKAQCTGVVVSIVERSEREELLVDDGTALIKAVLWNGGSQEHSDVSLGDLVHVEGKLNMGKTWDVATPSRELRALRISKLEDPNAELLYWTQVLELTETQYSVATLPSEPLTQPCADGNGQADWEFIAAEAFFNLSVSPSRRQQFLSRNDLGPHDGVLLETLQILLLQQKEKPLDRDGGQEAHSITFGDHLATIGHSAEQENRNREITKRTTLRSLRNAFATLRHSGLLFLENEEFDRHTLLTFVAVLKPALLELLRGRVHGVSGAEIADETLAQQRFRRIPLAWVETGLKKLLLAQLVSQREDSQLFFLRL